MSEPRGSSVDGIIDFTNPNTPPPRNVAEDENNEENDTPIRSERSGRKASSRSGVGAEKASLALTAANTASNGGPPKWGCQTVYLRVMGRKPGPNSNELNLVKPFKPMNYSIMGLFSKESNEERQIRHLLKSYKTTLAAELQHCSRASMRHRKRVADQFAEFEVHEGKLVGWGLKFIIPFFRMQAWSRLSRSTLMRDLSLELEQVMNQRILKTSLFLQTFEESINRKNKYSVAGTEEFCMRPDQFLERDLGLISMTEQLQGLDDICSSTTKRFMQFESEYAWHGQAMRKKILIRILKRYKSVPQISELTNIEEDLSWSDFCLWYANRNKIINQLELEFSDFVEDQREKEGRLFYRWHKSLFRAKEAYEAAMEGQQSAQGDGSAGGGGESSGCPGMPRKASRAVSISAINSFRLMDNSTNQGPGYNAGGDGGEGVSWADQSTSAGMKDRGASADSTDGAATAAQQANATSAAAAAAAAAASAAGAGAGTGGGGVGSPSDGIIALKVTPFSIKAFIKYFANDIIGVQYGIPKDCMAANLALTEALFFRRIHAHIYQYTSPQVYANDQTWRQQCQMCRFVDPTTYHVPPKYAVSQGNKSPSATTPPPPRSLISETVKTLKEVKDTKGVSDFHLREHFDAEARVTAAVPRPEVGAQRQTSAGTTTSAGTGTSPRPVVPAANRAAGELDPAVDASPARTAPTAEVTSPSPEGAQPTPSTEKVTTDSPTSGAAAEPDVPVNEADPSPDASDGALTPIQEATAVSGEEPGIPIPTHVVSDVPPARASSALSPPRMKMRLVSDDSTIYKTCFNEQQPSAAPSPVLPSAGGPPPPPQQSRISLLRASFGGFGSPKTSNQKSIDARRNSAGGESSVEATPESEGNQISSYTYGGEVPIKYDANDYPRMSISNIPEQFDGDEETDTVVPDMAAVSEAATAAAAAEAEADAGEAAVDAAAESLAEATVSSPQTPPPLSSRVHLNAGTVRGVQSVPVGGSVSSSRVKKHTNSGSPRSYLTANALKANDRALTVPTCSCNMCVTFAASTRLQRLAKYTEGQYGEAYARSSRVMSFLSTASTPGEIINILSLASKWLLRDAIDVSGSRETIGADLLVPLFTMVLINAQLPNVHMILQVLLDYGEYNEQGDVSYTIANLEGSILFILGLDVPADARDKFERSSFAAANPAFTVANRAGRNITMSRDITDKYSSDALCELVPRAAVAMGSADAMGGMGGAPGGSGAGASTAHLPAFTEMSYGAKAKDDHSEDDVQAMKQLGEWLRDQNTMEDTITILQKEGWMA